jgi:hypothetical protein
VEVEEAEVTEGGVAGFKELELRGAQARTLVQLEELLKTSSPIHTSDPQPLQGGRGVVDSAPRGWPAQSQ